MSKCQHVIMQFTPQSALLKGTTNPTGDEAFLEECIMKALRQLIVLKLRDKSSAETLINLGGSQASGDPQSSCSSGQLILVRYLGVYIVNTLFHTPL